MHVDVSRWRNRRRTTNTRYIQRYLHFTKNHTQPNPANYEALNSEHVNLMAAMEQAYQAKRWDQVSQFMNMLNRYLEVRGYWTERRISLEQAAAAAALADRPVDAAAFDSNLFSLIQNTTGFGGTDQEYLQILKIFLQHLQTFHALNDRQNIAITCHQLGILTFGASLEAEFSDGQLYKAVLIRLKAVPLDQDIEKGHRKADFGFKIIPNLVPGAFEITDVGQRRQNSFDEHTDVPSSPLAQLEVIGVPIFLFKTHIGQDNHLTGDTLNQVLKGGAIIDIGGITSPVD